MNLLLAGANGRLGTQIRELAAELPNVNITPLTSNQALDDIDWAEHDVFLDITTATATLELAQQAATAQLPLVIGTTGHTKEVREKILRTVKSVPVVWAGNFSIGVTLLTHLTELVARTLDETYHPEIVEMHHQHKLDAPSGTAKELVAAIRKGRNWPEDTVQAGRDGFTGQRKAQEIGVHALRGGEVVGEHTVYFAGSNERIQLQHQAQNRRVFAEGALKAARWVIEKPPGLYGMKEVLGLSNLRID